ncbi:MAG TPA: hypothetical protein VG095_00610, partial [Chthoniobacterales bacterium]|nr:hypothetical protein [Chthoniobacterales bacterium]
MPKLRAAVAGLLIGITPAAVIAEPATDLSEAQRAFLDFRLTSDGRGMVMSPRATRKMQALANSPLWPMLRYNGERRGGMIPQGRGFVGLDVVAIGGTTTGLFSCVVCHAGKAAGQFAPGLGNKNIDAYAGVALLGAEWEQDRRSLRGTKLSAAERQATEGSLHYLKIASREGLANQTQGMVSVSPIFLWLYEAAGREFPPELSITAAVKVPHLWGYDRKKEAGLFCDGMGDGSKPGWLAAVPLSSGFHPAAARNNYAKLLALERAFGELKPPPYGFPVAERQARHGKAVFQHNCSG